MSGLSTFEYIVGIHTIVLGLATAYLLTTITDTIKYRKSIRHYWVHTAWSVVLQFVLIGWWFGVLSRLQGTPWLMASLLYGAGLRVLECARLRVQDIDFHRNQILVRDGKGRKDRVTLLPSKTAAPLAAHIERVRLRHQEDIRKGARYVELPYALRRKYPRAARDWTWQWVFPATRFYRDRETGEHRRHHLHESVFSKKR